MKTIFFLVLISVSSVSFSQYKRAKTKKSWSAGTLFFYWGYNRGYYSASDIHFKGNDYDFTLKQVKANDRQSKLAADPYLRIDQITIPQYNWRLGYIFNEEKGWTNDLKQDNIILLCEHGHISDFPWSKFLRWRKEEPLAICEKVPVPSGLT